MRQAMRPIGDEDDAPLAFKIGAHLCRRHGHEIAARGHQPCPPHCSVCVSPRFTSRRSEARASRSTSTLRSEEHTSELQSLMRISYAVFCLKKKKQQKKI